MQLRVGGSSCAVPREDRACSSYLVRDGRLAFTLDLGTGGFANLRKYADYDELDAVVITHMHADHFLDLIPLRYALKYGPRSRRTRLPLWMPPDGIAMLRQLVSAFAREGNGDFLDEPFDVREFDPDRPLQLGEGTLRFARTTHYIPAYAMRYEHDGVSLTYSADTAPDARVVELAHGTDLFLCEATLLADDVEPGVRGHSSAAEAAHMAAAANARRLILTHYSSEAGDKDLAGGAKGIFSGEVLVADDHQIFEIVPARR